MRDGRTPQRGITLKQAHNLEDVRAVAHRKLPMAVKDFIEGGAEDELTISKNRQAFQDLTFERRALVDVSIRDQSTTLLGTPVSSPIALAPVGLAALAHPRGEAAAAAAAADRGIITTLSSSSTWSIEEVAEASAGPKWFQLYIWRDRELTKEIVERARAAGYKALALTVDVPVAARRERDLRNGFEIPPRPTVRHAGDVLRHAGWFSRLAKDELFGHGLTMGNFAPANGVRKRMVMMEMVNELFDPSVTWGDVEWLQSVWGGPLVIKGISSVADARRAVEVGVGGLWVSNHGGRQLDGLAASATVLPDIVDEVGDEVEVFLDGGVRRGSDVVKALALGARACMIGRPYIYGLAAGGQAGVDKVLGHFQTEIDATLALLGCTSVKDLDRSFLRDIAQLSKEAS